MDKPKFVRQSMPESLKNHGTERLLKAVQTMRDACDDAEHQIVHGQNDLRKATEVLHVFVRAWANAQMDVEACLSHVERWSELGKAEEES